MAKDNNLGDLLKSVADAIRTKKGTSANINPQNFDSEILSISGAAQYVNGSWDKITAAQTGSVLDAVDSSKEVFVQVYILANQSGANMSVTIQGCDDQSFTNPSALQTFTYAGAASYNSGTTYNTTVTGYRYYRVVKGGTVAYANHCDYFLLVK